MSTSVNQVLTHYTDNPQDSNLVLDLMFLHVSMKEFNNYMILLDLQSSSNHASLSVNIIIKEESIQDRKQAIIKNSKKEREFVTKLKNRIEYIVMTNIQDCKMMERVMQEFASIIEKL